MAVHNAVPELRPWAENVAGYIADPVKRLRFLRVVAPLAGVPGEVTRRRWSRGLFLLVIAAVAVLITLYFARA